ncbi:hypothetical protein M8C21_026483 [Ambrosia artemisiifolia]|uniref:Uncharacterized protein n=1 Tax=Ambrosia artemisiifolia TaxID=4212 RepID=A0AAD5G1Y0_AMBAR|nr:hypothetical protein M8C21_026483 [Ambrosia artemisiifolia]
MPCCPCTKRPLQA